MALNQLSMEGVAVPKRTEAPSNLPQLGEAFGAPNVEETCCSSDIRIAFITLSGLLNISSFVKRTTL